jgi:hypothetical protein
VNEDFNVYYSSRLKYNNEDGGIFRDRKEERILS